MSTYWQVLKGAIFKHVHVLMQEINKGGNCVFTTLLTETGMQAFHFFRVKPLRATKGIRYDAHLFGRDDKRWKTSRKRYAGA
jgi:hypothetical protein